jgi:hypothetical protein
VTKPEVNETRGIVSNREGLRIWLYIFWDHDVIYCISPLVLIKDKDFFEGRCWWFTPVILAIWETEIGRIKVQGQPRQNVSKTPSQPIARHGGSHLSSQAIWEADIRIASPGQPGKKVCEVTSWWKKVRCGSACHSSEAGSLK